MDDSRLVYWRWVKRSGTRSDTRYTPHCILHIITAYAFSVPHLVHVGLYSILLLCNTVVPRKKLLAKSRRQISTVVHGPRITWWTNDASYRSMYCNKKVIGKGSPRSCLQLLRDEASLLTLSALTWVGCVIQQFKNRYTSKPQLIMNGEKR